MSESGYKDTIMQCAGVDHNKEIPASERTGSAGYSMSLLCKQDKDQMDRIEEKLDLLRLELQHSR